MNSSFFLPLEEGFDPQEKRRWMMEHREEAFYYAGVYLTVIFGLEACMKGLPKMKLRYTLTAWNIFLAIFSAVGLWRTLPELAHVLINFGFTQSVCNPNFIAHDKVTAFWAWMFTISKLLVFGDTIFIILRRNKLAFLHWYHHIVVLLFTWYCYSEHVAAARWFMVVNFFVQSLLYTYYALRTMNIRVPRSFAVGIISLQVLQMAIGFIVCCFAFFALRSGLQCHFPKYLSVYGILFYAGFCDLFVRFFEGTHFSTDSEEKKLL